MTYLFDRQTIGRLVGDPVLPYRRLRRIIRGLLGSRPSSFPFISGDTFRAFSDHIFDETGKSSLSDLGPGSIIFCNGDYLVEFSAEVLQKSEYPLVVVLGNSDRNYMPIPELLSLLPQTHYYFVQNLTECIPACTPIPIGLENLHWENVGRPKDFFHLRDATYSRLPRVMWSFTVRTNRPIRKAARLDLQAAGVADFVGEVSPRQHRRLLTRYSFVASPPGNGWDTHRTWEAMYLRCVPIVLDSYFARHFVDEGLPIWIISSYEELSGVSEGELKSKYDEFSQRFESQTLWFNYWLEEIRHYSDQIRQEYEKSQRSTKFQHSETYSKTAEVTE
jgi:hypothetical protein